MLMGAIYRPWIANSIEIIGGEGAMSVSLSKAVSEVAG